MTTSQEKKDYILANIDKYVIDGRGNFYWANAEEEFDYIYRNSLGDRECLKIEAEMIKRIYETKEDWGVDFTEDDIHEFPILYYKNKKDGRIMRSKYFGITESKSVGKVINDYKGKSKRHLKILKIYQIITEEQTKLLEELEKNEREKNNSTFPTEEENRRREAKATQQELAKQKQQVSENIFNYMAQEPRFSNSDLSVEYQDWPQQLETMNDIDQIDYLKKRVLTYVSNKRKEKYDSAKKLSDNLKKAQTGTPEEKKQALENLEKNEGQKNYEEQKEEITKLKVEQATENLNEYTEKLIQKLTKKLTECELSETDLSSEVKEQYKKLKAGVIKDPTQLVTMENSITENIYQVKVNKELTNLITETNLVLNSNNKNQIEQVKSKLLKFINSSNIYYLVHQEQAKKQLARLENHQIVNSDTKTNNNLSLSTKLIIGGGVSLTVAGIAFLILKGRINLNSKKRK